MKNILITGASSGIGKATSIYLSEQGYQCVLVSRNKDELERISNDLPSKSWFFPYDLNNLTDIEHIYQFCAENDVKLDGLVHCAGITKDLPVRANDIDIMQEVLTVNYASFVELCKYFSGKKYHSPQSSIVAISSHGSQSCASGTCVYSSSKAAINAAVKVMSKEFLRYGIRVNAILPSFVNTPMIPEFIDAETQKKNQPLGIIEPEYISYLVEFLLSDHAKYITGTLFPITGGRL